MFQNLFDMSVKRTGLQALGFYIFYSVIGIVSIGLLCGASAIAYCQISNMCTPENGVLIGRKIGTLVGWISCIAYIAGIGFWILWSKHIYKMAKAMLLYILAVLLSFVLGALIPLIPLAILTTFDSKIEHKNENDVQELSE